MNKKNFIRIASGIFLVKLALALLPSFQVDMGAWLAWAYRLISVGPAHFYSDAVWTQYTPGYLYWLWLIGKLGWVDPLAIKITSIMADMLTGYLIWKIVGKVNVKLAGFSALFYVLNPVVLMDGSIWGQIDGILTLAMLYSTYLLIEKRQLTAGWAVYGIALLLKPQAVAILPIMLLLSWVRFSLKKTMLAGGIGLLVLTAGFWPFFPNNPIGGMIELVGKMGISYPYTSLYAFNLWGYIGMWKLDSTSWMGISYFGWGVGLTILAYLGVLFRYRNKLSNGPEIYLCLALACWIFYLFPTRVHERYLFPMFAYLITYAGLKHTKQLFIITMLATMIYLLNLYLPYSAFESLANPLKNIVMEKAIENLIPGLTLLYYGLFVWLWLSPGREKSKHTIPINLRNGKTVEER